MPEQEQIHRLAQLVVELDRQGVEEAIRAALAEGVTPRKIVSDGLAPGMDRIGQGFEEGEFFVPELLFASRVVQSALEILRPHFDRAGSVSAGRVVLGTVEGDVHQIGKNIVGIVLSAGGYEVHDLGENVPPKAFLEKAVEVRADVVGMSALISFAVSKMAETIAILRERSVPAKVIVGGAAVSPQTASSIGADAHGSDAWEALQRVRELVQREEPSSEARLEGIG